MEKDKNVTPKQYPNTLEVSERQNLDDLIKSFYESNELKEGVDVQELCKQLNIEYFTANLTNDNLDGLFFKNRDKCEIYIDSKLSEKQKKYMLAFELSRYILNNKELYLFEKDFHKDDLYAASNDKEMKLRYISNAILVPKKGFIENIKHFFKHNKEIDEKRLNEFVLDQSDKYKIQQKVILNRILDLGK